MWKLQATQRIGQAARLTLTLDNLFDYQPEYHYFNSPFTDGIAVMAGLSVDIDKVLKNK